MNSTSTLKPLLVLLFVLLVLILVLSPRLSPFKTFLCCRNLRFWCDCRWTQLLDEFWQYQQRKTNVVLVAQEGLTLLCVVGFVPGRIWWGGETWLRRAKVGARYAPSSTHSLTTWPAATSSASTQKSGWFLVPLYLFYHFVKSSMRSL